MRRNFLKVCGLAGLGLSMPLSDPARADDDALPRYDGPYFAVFNASGGWDTTALMDPKGIPEINRLYTEDDIQTAGAHRFAPTKQHMQAGMSNEDFFARYHDELLTFNGLDYSINNHSPCMRYMATGKLDSQSYPTFAALVAACKGSQCPIAFLTFGNYSATGNLLPMSRVPYLPSLKLLAAADAVRGSKHPYHDRFVVDHIERALQKQRESRQSKPRLPRRQNAQSMLYAAQSNSKSLERITPFIPNQIPKERLHQQAEIALAGFRAGVCVSANLSIGQFDSHANNDRDQMKLIPELLQGIDYLVRRSEACKIRDKLVIVIQSEMGRTPHYNAGQGKDHWSIGSIMFMGQGVQGGRVLGKTDERQFLSPINPQTMRPAESGIRVRPEHLHQALRELADIDQHTASEQFPLDVPPEERLQGFWNNA